MSDHEHVSDGFTYAEPYAPIDYPPFRQDYDLPEWKDSKGLYPRDRAMVEPLQRAHHSHGFAGATYSEQEARIRHFHNTYFEAMERQQPG